MRPEAIDAWLAVLSDHLSAASCPVLDLGSATGLWSVRALRHRRRRRRAFGEDAWAARSHSRVNYVAGVAERLPPAPSSCSHAWISTVIHHLDDLGASARELKRVLQPGGPVLIRGAFRGRTDGIPWLRFLPPARRLAEARWADLEETVAVFSGAGFHPRSLQTVSELSAPDLLAYGERVAARVDSTFSMMDEAEFERGLGRMRAAAERASAGPIVTRLDLLVLRAVGGPDR